MAQMEDQSDVIAFLSDPSAHGGAAVERIDTHMSHLFLTPHTVYKLMRAVRYPMIVDFADVAKRVAACRAELEANAAMAGDLYRRVRRITRDGEALAWDGAGETVDSVVEMARFDEATRFDRLAENGALERWMIDQIAGLAGQAHMAAPERPPLGPC